MSAPGQTLRMDKLVVIGTSRDPDRAATGPCMTVAMPCSRSTRAGGFDTVVAESRAVWQRLWEDCDCEVVGNVVHPVHCGSASTTR